MQQEKIDISKCEELVKVFERFKDEADHIVDKKYAEVIGGFYRELIKAKDKGEFIVGYSCFVPPEIFYAMDIPAYCVHLVSMVLTYSLALHTEVFGAASSIGFAQEPCGGTMSGPAVALKGWLPRPNLVVWDSAVCDNTFKTGETLAEIHGAPLFFIDQPYVYEDKEIEYCAEQMEQLIHLLEKMTNRSMDWDKLKKHMQLTAEMSAIRTEIYQMRKAAPSPARNTWTEFYMLIASYLLMGKQEGVDFLKLVRDEIKKLLDQGKGASPQEKYRVMWLAVPTCYDGELMDWMQLEKGISVVCDPGFDHTSSWEPDYNKPIESIAGGYKNRFV